MTSNSDRGEFLKKKTTRAQMLLLLGAILFDSVLCVAQEKPKVEPL